jgi:hypothetical protein
MKRPNVLYGALVGILLIVPLIVLFALANQLSGLPFPPFDLFPVIRDLTPGPVITATIDTMVRTITSLNLGRVDTAAKIAEQAMAILFLVGAGAVVGGLFFAAMRRVSLDNAMIVGVLLGIVAGIVMAVITQNRGLSERTGLPILNVLWEVILFTLWGWLLGRTYERLSVPEVTASTPIKAI